ncbi:hypothetical protein SDC9_92208 [bioreactor metagenome]|uniref:Uncharacterized protein n=1 Tax=bioreactor metagenome TaxID=1076179 RepID=A0A644ZZX2_9ZZZZ
MASITPAARMPSMTMNRPNNKSKVSLSKSFHSSFQGEMLFLRKLARRKPMKQSAIQISPLRKEYRTAKMGLVGKGKNDATMSSKTVMIKSNVGKPSSTWVSTCAVIRVFSLRNKNNKINMEAKAPSSTAQKIPGFPCIQKKSKKLI